jgi:DNA-binding LytR/AlgR family response regulator
MIKCVIIDDEQSAIDVIKRYVEKIPNLHLLGAFTDPWKGIEMIERQKCQVVFLDIEMDTINGIELAGMLQDVKIIFCTAHEAFAVTSYDIGAVDYLTKPIAFNRFVKAIQRLKNVNVPLSLQQDVIDGDYIFLKTEQKGKLKKLDLDELDYMESADSYVKFHLAGGNTTMAYTSLKKIEPILSPNQFLRIHRSYMVAVRQIKMIEGNRVILKRKALELPLGESYKGIFMAKISDRFVPD